MLKTEDAQKVCKNLYYNNCLCINRKLEKVEEILKWNRPKDMRKVNKRKKWDDEQDNFIMNHTIEESMEKLDRTKSSIKTRLYRLRKKK